MIMTFEEYILNWWYDYLGRTTTVEECEELMQDWIGEEETPSDYIPQDAETAYDWLCDNIDDAQKIYDKYFGYNACAHKVLMPETPKLLEDMFKSAKEWEQFRQYAPKPSFADEFIEDMAIHASDYDDPKEFFDDLSKGGCQSGMVGMLIYNSECKQLYIEHIDDMEDMKEEMEESFGDPIKNILHVPHYTFMCWLCYEELAFSIARELWPKTF